jgi:hypothetical protein
MRRIIIACAIAGILGVPAFGQGVDPLIGTWKVNLEKSTFVNSPRQKSLVTTFSGDGQNLIATTESVDAQGQAFKMVVTQIFDGQPHPTTGNPLWDATSLARIGNLVNIVRFKNGKPVAIARSETLEKTVMFTQDGIANNQIFHEVLVLERQ